MGCYNNPITAEIQFVVMGDEHITLTHVLNYPNPFVNIPVLVFDTEPYEPLAVQFK
jgi:hypothetical protein